MLHFYSTKNFNLHFVLKKSLRSIFLGQCFANPLLCENGFSVGLKVKFDDTSKEMNQPRYVIDTGGQNGQGFTIYLQNNKLYSQVAYNNKMWRVGELNFIVDLE